MVCTTVIVGFANLQILRPTSVGRQLILMMKWAGCKKHAAYFIYSFVSPLWRKTVYYEGRKSIARVMIN